jgi:hypothetical protein
MEKFSRINNFYVVLVMAVVLTIGILFSLENKEIIIPNQQVVAMNGQISLINKNTFLQNISNIIGEVVLLPSLPQKLINPPEIIKAVYVTGWSAGTKKYLDYLSNLFEKTEINAVVIDVKGSSGYVTYNSGAEEVKKYNLNRNEISDIDSLVRFFHNKQIYVIGRLAVFEDPVYSNARPELAIYDKSREKNLSDTILWKDNNGLSWLDPASKEVWDYNISLAKDAFLHGFDEINFDYIRFPSDGRVKDMGFPVWDQKKLKSQVIKEFFIYIRQKLPNEKISADLFGQTTINKDDMGIGQIIEDAFDSFDYIAPMLYPSHYAKGFIGFSNPAEYPYEVVKYSMENALVRAKLAESKIKFRPWIQDFNMGAMYNAKMVEQEIRALKDALGENYNGFMLWNPSNIYTQRAILKPN